MSKIFIKGVLADVGADGGADEIFRLRVLLERRNATIRELRMQIRKLLEQTK